MPNPFFDRLRNKLKYHLYRNEQRTDKNPFLRRLADKVQNSGTGRSGEFVFHGTDFRNVPSIQEQGFVKSYKGWYGPGVYSSHSWDTAREFGRVIPGTLPPGFRYRTLPPDTTTKEALKIFKQVTQSTEKLQIRDELFDIRNDFSRNLRGYHGLRLPGFNEPQLVIFDPHIANTIFDTKGPKAGPSTPLSAKPLTSRQAFTRGLVGLTSSGSYGGLTRMFATAEAANQLAEMTGLLSEMLFGPPLDPEKKTTTKDKTK